MPTPVIRMAGTADAAALAALRRTWTEEDRRWRLTRIRCRGLMSDRAPGLPLILVYIACVAAPVVVVAALARQVRGRRAFPES